MTIADMPYVQEIDRRGTRRARTTRTDQWSETVSLGELSTSQIEAIKKLGELANLPANWDGYGSIPLTAMARIIAAKILVAVTAAQVPNPSVVPVSGGGVQIEWERGDTALEIAVDADGNLNVVMINGEEIRSLDLLMGDIPIVSQVVPSHFANSAL